MLIWLLFDLIGILFEDNSYGAVFRTEVDGSFAAKISSTSRYEIKVVDVYVFDDNPDLDGVKNNGGSGRTKF